MYPPTEPAWRRHLTLAAEVAAIVGAAAAVAGALIAGIAIFGPPAALGLLCL